MDKKVLAVVAGKEITEADVDAFITHVPKEQQMYASHPQFRAQVLEQLIAMQLFAKAGEEAKLDETEVFKKAMEEARMDALAQMAVNQVVDGVTVTEEEMEAYYAANPAQFGRGATVSAKHILVDSEEKCSEILAAIQSGEKTFEAAAAEFSTCPSGKKGGDLGEFGKGQMVKEFETAAFEAEIGVVVGPVKTQFGYHLIKVEDKTEAATVPYSEAKSTIMKNLMQVKQNDVYTAKLKELKDKYLVK